MNSSHFIGFMWFVILGLNFYVGNIGLETMALGYVGATLIVEIGDLREEIKTSNERKF